MSHKNLADALHSAEEPYRRKVMQHTWGHLAPTKNRTYEGFIVFAIGFFGDDPLNPTVLNCDFGDLDSSPWFFQSVQDFIEKHGGDDNAGKVFRFDGTFRNYQFKGTVSELELVPKSGVETHAKRTR